MQLIKAVVDDGQIWLALVAVVNTVVSVYYYARIIRLMFLEESDDTSKVPLSAPVSAFVVLMIVPVLWLGVFFGSTVDFIRDLTLTLG